MVEEMERTSDIAITSFLGVPVPIVLPVNQDFELICRAKKSGDVLKGTAD